MLKKVNFKRYISFMLTLAFVLSFAAVPLTALADRHRNDGIYLQGQFRAYFQGNESGLHDQWSCHLLTVGHTKQPWNIEPGRPNVGLAETIAKACNPY